MCAREFAADDGVRYSVQHNIRDGASIVPYELFFMLAALCKIIL